VSVRQCQVAGFATWELTHAGVACTVVPELGGRVVSLRRPGGRQWLYRPGGRLRLWRNAPGDAFTRSPHVGLDECWPTIGACVVDGHVWADHGAVWSVPWQVVDGGSDHLKLRVIAGDVVLERSVHLTASGVRLAYRLEHQGHTPLAWGWAFHGLLAIRPGDRIAVPPEVTTVRPEVYRLSGELDPGADAWRWPRPQPGIDLSQLDLGGVGTYAKVAAGPLTTGWAALVGADGQRLTLTWDTAVAPWLGLWLTRGGYRHQHCLALEPATMARDRLEQAGQSTRLLAPGDSVQWQVELALSLALA
jgi:galactose mutarotase-like enzyme